MTVLRSSNRQTKVQPPANFTGVVFSDEIVQGSAPSRMRAPSCRLPRADAPRGIAIRSDRRCIACRAPAAFSSRVSRCGKSAPATP